MTDHYAAGTAPRLDPTAEEMLVTRLLGFVRLVRDHGFAVGVREGLDTLRIAKRGLLLDPQRLRWGLRSLLCSNLDEWRRFDALYDAYWRPVRRTTRVEPSPGAPLDGRDELAGGGRGGDVTAADQPQPGDEAGAAAGGARGGASHREAEAAADFRFLADARQMRRMEQLVERLAQRMRRRILRRQRVARDGRRVHLRRTLRRSLRYGGTPLELAFRRRRRQLPRLIVLLDVSRSMSLYSFLFLRFARGLLGAFHDAQAFVFHTRLVPVSEALREADLVRVKDKLAIIALGWSGGTRIGECVQAFNREHAPRLLNSRAVVVIVSDGLDTGAPALLAGELKRMRRRARRIVWLNPLLGRDGYEPRAGAMQAALPFLDVFAPAHSLESLEALEAQLVSV